MEISLLGKARTARPTQLPAAAFTSWTLNTGDASNWFQVEGAVEELYDVTIMPGVRRPMAIGFMGDEIRRSLSVV